jgi:hypothetical protein
MTAQNTQLQSADLAANRAGQLAEGQRATLERRIRSLRWMYLGIAAVFVAIAAMLTIGLLSEPGAGDILPVILGADAVILLLTLPIIWRMRREIGKVRDDLAAERIHIVDGPISLGYKGGSLIVGGQWFPLPQSTHGIDWTAPYIVYYAPKSRVIVFMELDWSN